MTSSVEGHNFHVFQIMPTITVTTNYKHLYKLQRGLTNATIINISISEDSRWIAVNSLNGTTRNIFIYFFIYLFFFYLK